MVKWHWLGGPLAVALLLGACSTAAGQVSVQNVQLSASRIEAGVDTATLTADIVYTCPTGTPLNPGDPAGGVRVISDPPTAQYGGILIDGGFTRTISPTDCANVPEVRSSASFQVSANALAPGDIPITLTVHARTDPPSTPPDAQGTIPITVEPYFLCQAIVQGQIKNVKGSVTYVEIDVQNLGNTPIDVVPNPQIAAGSKMNESALANADPLQLDTPLLDGESTNGTLRVGLKSGGAFKQRDIRIDLIGQSTHSDRQDQCSSMNVLLRKDGGFLGIPSIGSPAVLLAIAGLAIAMRRRADS